MSHNLTKANIMVEINCTWHMVVKCSSSQLVETE